MSEDVLAKLRGLPPSAWRVYLGVLCSSGRMQGVKQLAASVGASERTTHRGLRALRAAGFSLPSVSNSAIRDTASLFAGRRRR